MIHEPETVLVLTLYSGEAEFERCLESLARQTFHAWEHRVFDHLPNAVAHSRLYETVMAERTKHRLFFKLDADMVLADEEVLSDLVDVFVTHPNLDHLVVAVMDWMTQRPMIGAHLFSGRVTWMSDDDRLYVDPDPTFPGDKVVVGQPPRDLVLHSPDPSPLQAFHFGAHRALKASQAGCRLDQTRAHNARLQWEVLDRVWRHYEDTGDRRLGMALVAADMVFGRSLPATVNEYSNSALRTAFLHTERLTDEEIRRRLEGRWGEPRARRRLWRRALGPARSFLVDLRALRDTVASKLKPGGRTSSTVEIGRRGRDE